MSDAPLLPSASGTRMLELRILNGLHRGATLPLDGDAASLGSGENNDVVLLDPGITTDHARLVRNLRAVEVDSASGPGDTADRSSAPWHLHHHDGEIVPLWPDQAVPLGPLRIVLADEGAPWEPWLNASQQPLPAAGAAGATGAAASGEPARRRPALPLLAVWAGAGLTGIVAGLLTLNGLHDAGAAPVTARPEALAAAPVALAPQPASAPLLVYPMPPAAPVEFAAPPFALASVSANFAVTPDGQRLLPGDRYRGYKLVAIAAHSVLFTDAGGTVTALPW